MSYTCTPLTAPIFRICISQCYKIGNTSIWKSLVIFPCRLFFLEAPHSIPVFIFLNGKPLPNPSTTANTHFCQDLHILSFFESDLRSPYPTNINTSHLNIFRLDLPHPSSSLIINWTFSSYLYSLSRPIRPVSLFSFFFPSTPSSIPNYFWQSATPTRILPRTYNIHLPYVFFFWLRISYPSVLHTVTQTCFYFVDAGKISTIIKITTLISMVKLHKRKYFLKCKTLIINVHVRETYKRLQF